MFERLNGGKKGAFCGIMSFPHFGREPTTTTTFMYLIGYYFVVGSARARIRVRERLRPADKVSCPCKDKGGTHTCIPRPLPVVFFFFAAHVPAAFFALLGIRTADAGISAFFRFVQGNENTDGDGEKYRNDDAVFKRFHDYLTFAKSFCFADELTSAYSACSF